MCFSLQTCVSCHLRARTHPLHPCRRWFTRDSSEGDDAPARASGRSQAQAERDIESGDPLGREQQWPRAADSGAASPQPAEPEAPGHRTDASSAADGSGLAAGADPAVERQWRSAHDSEITAAPTAAVEAGRAGPAADAGGTSPTADTTSAPIEHSSGSGKAAVPRIACQAGQNWRSNVITVGAAGVAYRSIERNAVGCFLNLF